MSDVPAGDAFHHDLLALGFAAVQKDRRGVLQYARKPNRYLTEWVHDDGRDALFTWEYALGEFCESAGWQIGSAEASAHILYPQFDVQLDRDVEAIAVEVARLEGRLSGLNLADPDL